MTTRSMAIAFTGLALAAAARAQEIPAPSLAVGDSWSYRETDLLTKNETGQLSETVTAADATEYWIDARRQARTWWRGDAVKHLHREQFTYAESAPDQRGKTIATNDAGCAYPWPLKVGQQFECTEKTTWPNGWKVRYELKFAVEAAESVQTPAGRFDTLRLVAKGFATNETSNVVSRQERTFWLAAAVKREVKHEIRTVLPSGQVFKAEGRELVGFKAGGS
ncbi:MAG TPA: hypothetical protein VLA16_04075 [Ideonella sp.]|nr:hypothetical protein [Ideonella sp.]